MTYLTEEQVNAYHRDGFVIVRSMFDQEEIDLLHKTALADRALDQKSFGRDDGEGGTVRLSLWNHPGDNIYGMFARSNRLVDAMESVLGGEVYHYHSKMILKDAKVGGAWAWHQDYGYWYHFGCLYPLMASASIAVDKATIENGCLQIIKGSHKMGRIDHILTGDQAGADLERVQAALDRMELVYCEADPGDVVIFDSNVLHRSDQNKSDNARWAMVVAFNAARNDPYKEGQHPNYTPLEKVDDGAIKRVGAKRFEESDEVDWLTPETDQTAKELESVPETS
ncbi:MAG: phytanoyl-CoA dioxygenase family protein [Candidatus Promineifilaceae bacterium]|nr:phytanoyl-CoA dioxygenase family protein [Candidatus Promineifilaceae bacterium]